MRVFADDRTRPRARAGARRDRHADHREFGIIASCLHPGNVAIERRQESDAESDQEPMMAIETIAEAGLAMISLPDHVNFLEGIVMPRDQLYMGRG